MESKRWKETLLITWKVISMSISQLNSQYHKTLLISHREVFMKCVLNKSNVSLNTHRFLIIYCNFFWSYLKMSQAYDSIALGEKVWGKIPY